MARIRSFGDLDPGAHFVVVDKNGKPDNRIDREEETAAVFVKESIEDIEQRNRQVNSLERQEGFCPDGRTYYARLFFGFLTTEVSEKIADETPVIELEPVFFHIVKGFMFPFKRIGPFPESRPERFFKKGQKVWVLRRGTDTMRWIPATISKVAKSKRHGCFPPQGPFVYLEENFGINPGARGAIRFDSTDIWPREDD